MQGRGRARGWEGEGEGKSGTPACGAWGCRVRLEASSEFRVNRAIYPQRLCGGFILLPPRKMAASGSEVRGERVRGKMGSEV